MLSHRLPVINLLTNNNLDCMKPIASDYYTDPIVYKEGFFKDRKEEQAYIARIAEQVEQQKALLAKKAKKMGQSKSVRSSK